VHIVHMFILYFCFRFCLLYIFVCMYFFLFLLLTTILVNKDVYIYIYISFRKNISAKSVNLHRSILRRRRRQMII